MSVKICDIQGKNFILVSRLGADNKERTLTFDIDEAEKLWQELMEVCHDYRRNGIIEQVNN